jgi:hypothetical protein
VHDVEKNENTYVQNVKNSFIHTQKFAHSVIKNLQIFKHANIAQKIKFYSELLYDLHINE